MNDAYLLMGGNVGDTSETFQRASIMIEERCGPISKKSSIYKTAPWGKSDQQDFLNQAIMVHTGLGPVMLMETILLIEQELGRQRLEKYGPRVIDIDILLYDDFVLDNPVLTIPHPALQHRRFALTPLTDIAGDLIHPVLHKSIRQILKECQDDLAVTLID